MPSTSNFFSWFSATLPASQMRLQLMVPAYPLVLRSNRPVRALVEPAGVKINLALEEYRLAVLDLDRIEVAADQEEVALPGVYVRVLAIEKVLVNCERADDVVGVVAIVVDRVDGCVATQRRMIRVVLVEHVGHLLEMTPVAREIDHVLPDLGAP